METESLKTKKKNIKPSDFRSGIVKEDRYEQALKIQASICAADKNFSRFFFSICYFDTQTVSLRPMSSIPLFFIFQPQWILTSGNP